MSIPGRSFHLGGNYTDFDFKGKWYAGARFLPMFENCLPGPVFRWKNYAEGGGSMLQHRSTQKQTVFFPKFYCIFCLFTSLLFFLYNIKWKPASIY